VHTELCYCGQRGCLERICSSKFLRQNGDRRGLLEAAAAFSESSPVNEVCHHLAVGLANCVNFIRPNRVHLISPLTEAEAFCDALVQRVRDQVLNGLADRLTIEWSSPPADDLSQAAGWLGLTAVYLGDWSRGLNDRHAAPAYRRGCDS
jgi:predicted NBD/HSP70 family sugar kinase